MSRRWSSSQSDGTQHSIEFCGGTHASRTGDIGLFKVVAEESVSKGVRRITAVTGEQALSITQRHERDLKAIGQTLGAPVEEAPARLLALRDEVKTLKKKLASGGGSSDVDPVATVAKLLESAALIGGVKVVVAELAHATDDQLRSAIDAAKARGRWWGRGAARLGGSGKGGVRRGRE